MNIEEKLNQLKKIRPSEPSPLLLGRILNRLGEDPKQLSTQWKMGFAVAALLLLSLNVTVLITLKNKQAVHGIEQVVDVMHLSVSNDLYDE